MEYVGLGVGVVSLILAVYTAFGPLGKINSTMSTLGSTMSTLGSTM